MFHINNKYRPGRMLNLTDILYSFELAVLARVLLWLIEPGQIFGFWGQMLERKRWTWPAWIRNPLGYCPRCFSGQIGFWGGAILSVRELCGALVVVDTTTHLATEIFFKAAFYAAFTMFFNHIIHARTATT